MWRLHTNKQGAVLSLRSRERNLAIVAALLSETSDGAGSCEDDGDDGALGSSVDLYAAYVAAGDYGAGEGGAGGMGEGGDGDCGAGAMVARTKRRPDCDRIPWEPRPSPAKPFVELPRSVPGHALAPFAFPSGLTPTANEGTDGDGDKAEETAEDKDEADEDHTRPVTATASISFANSTARPAGPDHAPCGTGYNGNGAKAVVLLDDDGNVLRSFESQKEAVIALGINATAVRARATRTHDSAGSDYEGW